MSRSSLPENIGVTRARRVGPKNRHIPRKAKKRVRFNLANTPTQDRARRIKKKVQEITI